MSKDIEDRKEKGEEFFEEEHDESFISEESSKLVTQEGYEETDSLASFSFSKYTISGVIMLLIFLFIQVSSQIVLGIYLGYPQNILDWMTQIFVLIYTTLIIFVLFSVGIDILNYRGFKEWGAIGVFIAFIGYFLFFLPVYLVILNIGYGLIYIGIMALGVLLFLIGLTSQHTEYDGKVEDQIIKIWYGRKKLTKINILSGMFYLGFLLLVGTLRGIIFGTINLKTRFIVFMKLSSKTLKIIGHHCRIFLTETLPATLSETREGIWANIHWFGLVAVVLFFISYLNLFNVNEWMLIVNYWLTGTVVTAESLNYVILEIMLIVGFFFLIGVIHPHISQLEAIIERAQEYTWKTGYKMNYYVQRVVKREKIKCKFCGELIPKRAKICEHCSKEVIKCKVCWLAVEDDESLISCQHCRSTFHKTHWYSWVHIHHKCPVCREQVR
ncbi:MAG: hypothetical protein ACFFCZ_10035 [Promethearchaeota archaeon]